MRRAVVLACVLVSSCAFTMPSYGPALQVRQVLELRTERVPIAFQCPAAGVLDLAGRSDSELVHIDCLESPCSLSDQTSHPALAALLYRTGPNDVRAVISSLPPDRVPTTYAILAPGESFEKCDRVSYVRGDTYYSGTVCIPGRTVSRSDVHRLGDQLYAGFCDSTRPPAAPAPTTHVVDDALLLAERGESSLRAGDADIDRAMQLARSGEWGRAAELWYTLAERLSRDDSTLIDAIVAWRNAWVANLAAGRVDAATHAHLRRGETVDAFFALCARSGCDDELVLTVKALVK